jgi:hypothetical protein
MFVFDSVITLGGCSVCEINNLLDLVHYMIDVVDGDGEAETEERFRDPFVVSEMLAEDISQVREALMDQQCLELLFGFLERQEAIEAVYARNVCRVFHNMLCQFGKEVCLFGYSGCCLSL